MNQVQIHALLKQSNKVPAGCIPASSFHSGVLDAAPTACVQLGAADGGTKTKLGLAYLEGFQLVVLQNMRSKP